MAMPIESIGTSQIIQPRGLEEEMIGITAIPSRQDVAEVLANLLRENHALTQELEDSREDVTMYERVARDVETKWMLCEEVIGDLRSQVPHVCPLVASHKGTCRFTTSVADTCLLIGIAGCKGSFQFNLTLL